jgi:hypothetical protein
MGEMEKKVENAIERGGKSLSQNDARILVHDVLDDAPEVAVLTKERGG